MGAQGFQDVATETQAEIAKATTTIFADTMEGICNGRPLVYYMYCVLLEGGLLEISSADLPFGTGSNSSDVSYPCSGTIPRENKGKGLTKLDQLQTIASTPITIDFGAGGNPFLSGPQKNPESSVASPPHFKELQALEFEEKQLAYIQKLSDDMEKVEKELDLCHSDSRKKRRLEKHYAFMEEKYDNFLTNPSGAS